MKFDSVSLRAASLWRSRGALTSLLHSRLVHFALIGGLCFWLAPAQPRRIELSSQQLGAFGAAQAARDGLPALAAQRVREVEARAVEDELLYREALRLRLEQGDPIVRQRLIQKLLLLAEDLGGASRPATEPELRAWFEATQARWRQPARLHFLHVFASRREALPEREALPGDARSPPALGEAFPREREATLTRDAIASLYGDDFARALTGRPGAWSGPVSSPFGWHRVLLLEALPETPASFEQVRKELELDFLLARRARIIGGYLRKLAADYEIRVDERPLDELAPTGRVATRAAPSAED